MKKNRIVEVKETMTDYKKPVFWVIIVAAIACIVVAVCFLTGSLTQKEHSSDPRVYLGDIDLDGTEEYISYYLDEDDKYIFSWVLYCDDEAIYHGANINNCDFGEAWYLDLDDDGEKEIFLNVYPHVNSAAQVQYVALKRTGTGWKELENTDEGYESDTNTNAFPIHVYKGKEKNLIEISCDGCENTVEYDVTEHYTQLLNRDGDLKDLANAILNTDQYDDPGIMMGEPAAWGVWATDSLFPIRRMSNLERI